MHITEFLAELIENDKLTFPEDNGFNGSMVTYHDSCRLGRFMGVYDAPRKILGAIPGLKLSEMEHNRNRSLCCGVSNWTNCTNTSRSIRAERLLEAKATKAETLITSCPKCQIHLKCYTNNEFVEPQIKLDIEDITVFTAKAAGLDI
jgi:Fe-S oxidoreductase